MPVDWTKDELRIGDKVLIHAIVTDIRSEFHKINLQVKLTKVIGNEITYISVNTKQVEKVK